VLCVSDSVGDSVRFAVAQPTEWQRIGNQIDTAMIFARADFVNAHGYGKRFIDRADEMLTAFVELESVIHGRGELV
jgi:hypothetical protein